jgi:hypothetical protein
VLEARPKVFIFGTGYSGFLKVSDTLQKHFVNQGILVIKKRPLMLAKATINSHLKKRL